LHRTTGYWAKTWEHWLLNYGLDAICVGSEFHKNMLRASFGRKIPIYPLGLAWRPVEVRDSVARTVSKEKIVIFPHRIAPEKNPEAFYELADRFAGRGWRFVVSTNNPHVADTLKPSSSRVEVVCHKTKQDYYDFLNTCSIYYSNATQETFGYALHEAIAFGLAVVAPMRCSYPEMLNYDARFLYDTLRDPLGLNLLDAMLNNPVAVPFEYTSRWNAGENVFIAKILSE
jgi:glycosyltransferase involved in cell wall biosynthesis